MIESRGPIRSPLRGRYLVQNRGWNVALQVTDAVLSRVVRMPAARPDRAPSRILIAIGGHLGDAVIATTVLPVLARAYPNASFGMLLPSWSRVVVDGHPTLRWIHHADHWKMSRAPAARLARWSHYRSTAANAVRDIRAVGYDVAIDLYAYFPNAARLLWHAGIPTRIGYTSGGCGPLYTDAIPWPTAAGHTATQHARLVERLTGTPLDLVPQLRYDLPPIAAVSRTRARGMIGAAFGAGAEGDYVVLHPGAGDAKKLWPLAQWHELIARLCAAGERIVLTGAGAAERTGAAMLAQENSRVLDLVDQIDWPTFRAVLDNAKLVIGADSVAVHVAAAEQTPAIAIMAAMSDPEQWRPLGAQVRVLTRAVPCAPCFQKHGCEAMTCVRAVTVDDVLAAASQLAGASAPAGSSEIRIG